MRSHPGVGLPAQRGRQRPAPASAPRRPSADWLTLPRFDKSIRAKVALEGRTAKLAQLAISLAKAGWIGRTEHKLEVVDAIGVGMGRWLASVWGGPEKRRFIRLEATLIDDISQMPLLEGFDVEDFAEEIEADCGLDPKVSHVAMLFLPAERNDIAAKSGVMKIEALSGGLGFEALRQADESGLQFGLIGPNRLSWWASYGQWGGFDSEREYIEEHGLEEGDFAGVPRARFDELLPKHCYAGERMSRKELLQIEQEGAPKAARIAAAVRELRAMPKGRFAWSELARNLDCYAESFETPCVVRWVEGMDMDRILDDYYRDVMESESMSFPGLWATMVPTGDSGWFGRQEKKWARLVRQADLVDELLRALAGDRG